MDEAAIQAAVTEQLDAGLAMLRECVSRCPDELWTALSPRPDVTPSPVNPKWNGVERSAWRIAFHAVYFTHLYLGQGESAFEPPRRCAVGRRPEFEPMWSPPWALEPYELPAGVSACRREDILEYLDWLSALAGPTVARLDLASPSSGFTWYPAETKLSHALLNVRHLQGHVGQLSELLMQRGIDIEWV